MAIAGKRRAALLLMNLDSQTATQLLRSAPPQTLREIAAELAYLHASGKGKKAAKKILTEFYQRLAGGQELGDHSFLRGVLGESKEAMEDVYGMVNDRDPFLGIKSSPAEDVALAIRGEAPEVVSVLLDELSNSKGQELLSLLDPEVRERAICSMATGVEISRRAKHKVATAIQRNLNALRETGQKIVNDDTKLRQVAVLLQGLRSELRDSLVDAIKQQDTQMGETVSSLMVIWPDVKRINDRCMQNALRSVDARTLALALVEATQATVGKIKDNISERVRDMLEEESSLLSNPKEEEVTAAREEILNGLREMNLKGDLTFDFERSDDEEEE